MGRSSRPRPRYLARKLSRIRQSLSLSQEAMAEGLGGEPLNHASVSGYELGTREPPLAVLLEYARLANVLVEVLIDDELDLPEELPSRTRHEGLRRVPVALGRRRRGTT
jgi:transcriptional regulator with XRE-family HTH domain